jgi:hypothetical protein
MGIKKTRDYFYLLVIVETECSPEAIQQRANNVCRFSLDKAIQGVLLDKISVSSNELINAARRLHSYLVQQHWNGEAVVGPDPGIRFNARIGRFIKSYLYFFPWSDNLCYMQAQGYWIFDNWIMYDVLHDDRYRKIAQACSEYLLSIQHSDGFWEYPNPEWRGRIATVEGCFAALGLLESYSRLRSQSFFAGAKKWYRYLLDGIGFRRQEKKGMRAINYFASDSGDLGGVPNNSTLVLWTLARLAELTNDDQFLALCPSLVSWLKHVQLENGELPYSIGASQDKDRNHFLCYQYNAFEFMDLVNYHRITGDQTIWSVIEHLATYLASGLTANGAARYDCFYEVPEVNYYTLAVARALSQAKELRIGDYRTVVDQAYRRVLSHQGKNGGFNFHSRANYVLLSDRRSYPRYLSMILNHLLREYLSRATLLNAGYLSNH